MRKAKKRRMGGEQLAQAKAFSGDLPNRSGDRLGGDRKQKIDKQHGIEMGRKKKTKATATIH